MGSSVDDTDSPLYPYTPGSQSSSTSTPPFRPSTPPSACALVCDSAFWAATFTTCNAALGAGVLAYPYAFMSAGLVPGPLLLLGLASLSCASLLVLVNEMASLLKMRPAVQTYTDIALYGLGPKSASFLQLIVLLNALGACWAYNVLLADVLAPVVIRAFSLDAHEDTYLVRTAVMGSCAAICKLLCMLRRISALRYSSLLAVLATLFTVLMLVKDAVTDPCVVGKCYDELGRNGWCTEEQLLEDKSKGTELCDGTTHGLSLWQQSLASLLRAFPLVAFALQCHVQACSVYIELPPRLRSPAVWSKVALAAICVVSVLYMPTGIAGFVRFGVQTQGDVLRNFDVSDSLADLARVCIAVAALCAFPLQHYPVRAILHSLSRTATSRLRGCAGEAVEPISINFVRVEAIVWCASVLLLSLSAGDSLSSIFQLVGAVCGGTVVFSLPGVLALKTSAFGRAYQFLGGCLLGVGLFITVSGTYVTIASML
uniref:Amino acid transporter transmembrane domain-containing protein n=1 Tax=Coccolithus braarudii TaxID=221442 RepID=A0A7S0Q5N9_9EUKA|mmetsp:Transcript_39831/g.84920  ORF Transcript_39831/g.84920 Transcript_39831/m.84920 type:complete len:485 (+) Transcript_39831:1-1455(+)